MPSLSQSSDQSDAHDFTQPIQLSMSFNISSEDSSVTAHTRQVKPVVISTDITKRYLEKREGELRNRESIVWDVVDGD